jgi:EpsI family protein
MRLSRSTVHFAIAIGLLATTAALVSLPLDAGEVRHRASLATVPRGLGEWTGSDGVPAEAVAADPKAPEHLSRTYRSGEHTVWLSVDYYPFQSEGNRPPAQELLFPRHGWTELSERLLRVPLDAEASRSLISNLVIMRTDRHRLAIVYWYQIGRHSIASDHWYRARVVYNRLAHRRADGALVRVVSPISETSDTSGEIIAQKSFIRLFYPELLRSLPL